MTEAASLTYHASAGQGPALAETLLRAAALVAEAPGCELWLVHRDQADADAVRVTELWASRARCETALDLPGARENAAAAMGLLDRPPEVSDGEALGGAGMVCGETGATLFAILDAPDLSQDTELLEVLAFGSHTPGDGEMVAGAD
jgi:quinol monooxygenase YgiN